MEVIFRGLDLSPISETYLIFWGFGGSDLYSSDILGLSD